MHNLQQSISRRYWYTLEDNLLIEQFAFLLNSFTKSEAKYELVEFLLKKYFAPFKWLNAGNFEHSNKRGRMQNYSAMFIYYLFTIYNLPLTNEDWWLGGHL